MQRIFDGFHGGRLGLALLLLRFITGLAFVFHGWPKVTDVAGFAAMTKLPMVWAAIAAYTEVVGGVLLILGLLTPLAASLLAIEMAVAMLMVHFPAGHPFVSPRGPSFELAAVYLFVMLAFLLAGPGAYSLDARLMRRWAAGGVAAPAVERRRGMA